MSELSVKQAAERLGVTPQRIRDYLKQRRLASRLELGDDNRTHRWIPEAEVERLLAERRAKASAEKKGRGRPPRTSGP